MCDSQHALQLLTPIRYILELSNEVLHDLVLQRAEKLQPLASIGTLEVHN